MDDWPGKQWMRRHATIAPIAVCLMTGLLVFLARPEQPSLRGSLTSASQMVNLAALLYATIAVLIERGVRMWFWALDQRRQWRQKWEDEAEERGLAVGVERGRAEGLEEGVERGRAEGIEVGVEQGRAEGLESGIAVGIEQGRAEADREFEEWLERVREAGIDIDSLPPRQ